jgi:hypothetical protein
MTALYNAGQAVRTTSGMNVGGYVCRIGLVGSPPLSLYGLRPRRVGVPFVCRTNARKVCQLEHLSMNWCAHVALALTVKQAGTSQAQVAVATYARRADGIGTGQTCPAQQVAAGWAVERGQGESDRLRGIRDRWPDFAENTRSVLRLGLRVGELVKRIEIDEPDFLHALRIVLGLQLPRSKILVEPICRQRIADGGCTKLRRDTQPRGKPGAARRSVVTRRLAGIGFSTSWPSSSSPPSSPLSSVSASGGPRMRSLDRNTSSIPTSF